MDPPPPYFEKSAQQSGKPFWSSEDDGQIQRLCIRDEVNFTRRQHIVSIVDALIQRVRGRAKNGFGRSEIILVPCDQDTSNAGHMVIFGHRTPDVIQLEGEHDTTEFWQQPEVLTTLKQQVIDTLLADFGIADPPEPSLPPPPPPKSSWFGRRQSQESSKSVGKKSAPPKPVTVEVDLTEICFRRETEYGLMETTRRHGVSIDIHVR